MDSFFGIGFPELVFILILAGLVMGPKRIHQVARTLGRFVAQMQAISQQFTRQLNAELDALDNEEVKGAVADMKQLRRDMNELQQQVRSIPEAYVREGRRATQEGERMFKPRSQPAGEASSQQKESSAVPSPADLPKPIEVPDDPE